MLNTSGAQVAKRSYLPFGAQWAASGSLPTDFGFTGQREADEIGLYYYVARWLDPEIAHFAQADTIVPGAGNPAAYNRYGYVMYNPLKYTDPSGHRNEGVWCMNHPDDPGCRVLERNYDPEAAVAYAADEKRTEESYRAYYKSISREEDKPTIDALSLCTIFVMDCVMVGGGWNSGLEGEVDDWSEGTAYNRTDLLYYYLVESRDDVELIEVSGDVFNAEDFQIGDIVLYDQHVLDDQGNLLPYNHAMIVTNVDISKNEVWIYEMSGPSSEQGGRNISETTFPIFGYVIIRINEFK
jgi:RHS repeat-associated protein